MTSEKIIAIRKTNRTRAHQHFESLMSITEKMMNDDAIINPSAYNSLSPTKFEDKSVEMIRKACANTPFDADEVKLVSGHRFPDIIANTFYGVEVKSTKGNHWTSVGSSIMESTRNVNVEDIYMLFGKLGGNVPEVKCRPYEEVLYDIAVTHSPRYLINMEIDKKDTIFEKMGVPYDELRTSEDSIDQVRRYYREKAQREQKIEMPWWITSANIENPQSFNIHLWNTLSKEVKEDLQTKCMVLFPEALNPERNQTKYNRTTLWLCSYHQVIVPNIRDFYSAGGKITHVNGKKISPEVPQVFHRMVNYAERIQKMLSCPSTELLLLMQDYHPSMLHSVDKYEYWLGLCCEYAKKYNVPLREWIKKKPVFTFSKKEEAI